MEERVYYERGDLRVCVGHKAWVEISPGTYMECVAHKANSLMEDEELLEPVEPVAFLPHHCGPWLIGGRDELLQLREEIDDALSYIV